MDLRKIKEQLEQTKTLNDRLILVQMIAYITLGKNLFIYLLSLSFSFNSEIFNKLTKKIGSFCENDDILKSDKTFMESMMTNNESMNDLSEWMNLLFKLFLDEAHKNGSTAANNHENDKDDT